MLALRACFRAGFEESPQTEDSSTHVSAQRKGANMGHQAPQLPEACRGTEQRLERSQHLPRLSHATIYAHRKITAQERPKSSEWIKVVTNPLGLAGFALFLVFGYLAKLKRLDERRWIAPIAMLLALGALIGGLTVAYIQVPKAAPVPAQNSQPALPAKQQTNQQVQQTSKGDCSPNVQGVQGDVTISADCSESKAEARKPAAQKYRQDSK